MSHRESDERLMKLEVGVTHVQRLYEQLNEVVTGQTSEIIKMQRRIEDLQRQIKLAKEKPEPMGDPLDEKPPHY